MRRGEVWWVNFDPSVGGEATKVRPAVIMSNDSSNRHLNRLQVVPITSNVSQLYAGEAYVSIVGSQRKAQVNLLTTVSKERVSSRLNVLSTSDVEAIERAIRLQLQL
jgi:mRNA interferase MazF